MGHAALVLRLVVRYIPYRFTVFSVETYVRQSPHDHSEIKPGKSQCLFLITNR